MWCEVARPFTIMRNVLSLCLAGQAFNCERAASSEIGSKSCGIYQMMAQLVWMIVLRSLYL